MMSGCSVWMVNKTSPIRLKGCHLWAPVVDSALATGFGVVAVVADQNSYVTEKDRATYMMGSVIIASAFATAALMGYGDYHKCKE